MESKKLKLGRAFVLLGFSVLLGFFFSCDPEIEPVEGPTHLNLVERSGVAAENLRLAVNDSKELVVWQSNEAGERLNVTADVKWDDNQFGTIDIVKDSSGTYVLFTAMGVSEGEKKVILSGSLGDQHVEIEVTIFNPLVALEFAPELFEMDFDDDQFFFKVNGVFKDGQVLDLSADVTLVVSSGGVISVDENRKVTAISPGEVTVTAYHNTISGLKVSKVFNVKNPVRSIEVLPDQWYLLVDSQQQFEAKVTLANGENFTTLEVDWDISNLSVASVDATGLVTSNSVEGIVEVFARIGVVEGSASLRVTASTLLSLFILRDDSLDDGSIEIYDSAQFTAWATYINSQLIPVDVTNSVEWISSNSEIVSVELSGVASGLAEGEAEIHATLDGLDSNKIILSVLDPPLSLAVSPSNFTMNSGDIRQFAATATYKSGKVEAVDASWSSSKESLVQVSEDGTATGAGGGTVEIVAKFENVHGQASLTILPWYDIAKEAFYSELDFSSARVFLPSNIGELENVGTTTLTGGFTNVKEHLYWLAEPLAEDGFIVVTVSASDNLSIDGYHTAHLSGVELIKGERDRDGSPIYEKVGRYGVMGYSMGGGGCLTAAHDLGDEIYTAIGLAPFWNFLTTVSPPQLSGIKAATFVFAGDSDGVATSKNAYNYFYQNTPSSVDRLFVSLKGQSHQYWSSQTGAKVPAFETDIISAWLKYYLSEDLDAYDFFKEKPTGTSPEIMDTGDDEKNYHFRIAE
ncbi:MAG: Ig-like domain-containing protein [Spirochaetales bacterium]|nr:Ig-like domain-containing protein [Spirochaetales bacterium]